MANIICFPVVHHPKSQLEQSFKRANIKFNYETDLPLRKELEAAIGEHWNVLDSETKDRIIEKLYVDSHHGHGNRNWNQFYYDMKISDVPFCNAIKNVLEKGAYPVKTEDYSEFSRWDLSVEERTRKRDEAIAKNVGDTLVQGETGILLLGDSHHADDIIETNYKDIAVERIPGKIFKVKEILGEQYKMINSKYGIY